MTARPTVGPILAAVGDGARTFQVARRLSIPTPKARYHLKKLERLGIVKRCARLTFDNDIFWLVEDGI